MVAMDDHERVVPFELGVGATNCGDEIAVVVALDEVHNALGVGLGRQNMAIVEQACSKLAVVLNDPVEHHGHVTLRIADERVRVLDAHSAVRRPACVADSGTQGGRGDSVKFASEGCQGSPPRGSRAGCCHL